MKSKSGQLDIFIYVSQGVRASHSHTSSIWNVLLVEGIKDPSLSIFNGTQRLMPGEGHISPGGW